MTACCESAIQQQPKHRSLTQRLWWIQPLIIIKSGGEMNLKISHLCAGQMQFCRMASVRLPFFFLLFVLGWQSWPLISILPIMQMRMHHIWVQMSKASAEAMSPLGPSGNLHLKAIWSDKTMVQVRRPWPRASSSPVRQKVGVTPVSAPFCQLLVQISTVWAPPPLNELHIHVMTIMVMFYTMFFKVVFLFCCSCWRLLFFHTKPQRPYVICCSLTQPCC